MIYLSHNIYPPHTDGDSVANHTTNLAQSADSTDTQMDALFTALANPRRRFLIRTAHNADTAVTLEALIADLVAWETDHADTEQTVDRDEVALSLHHIHIPKLVAADLITHDEAEGTIASTMRTAEGRAHLRPVPNN